MAAEPGMLLIGGGVASASAAVELRERGYDGPVTLLTRELDAPYHRPPISKGLLLGTGEDLAVLPEQWWADHDVQMLTRSAVTTLDLAARSVTLASKRELAYDKALVATGAMVRRLPVPGAALRGIHYLRAPMNARSLGEDLATPKRVVLIGGSFIAVEVAASLTKMGHECTMLMLEDRCLDRTFGGVVAEHVDQLLRSHGITMICGASLAEFHGDENVSAVITEDGRSIPADVVVIGAGAVPDVKLARSAGLTIGESGGIACDATLRTSDAHVYSAGDACEYDSVLHGMPVRIEHEQHAQAQGVTAARNMLGANEDHRVVPYFWTDIADWATLEYVGVSATHDEELVTGSLEAGEFTVWRSSAGRLVSALTCGRPADLDAARTAILDGGPIPA